MSTPPADQANPAGVQLDLWFLLSPYHSLASFFSVTPVSDHADQSVSISVYHMEVTQRLINLSELFH